MTDTAKATVLNPGDALVHKGKNWRFAAIVSTSRSHARKYGDDPDASFARDLDRGTPTAWTRRAPAILDTTGQANRERMEDLARAIEVEDGQIVSIEGVTYRVRVIGQMYSDPISFTPVQ